MSRRGGLVVWMVWSWFLSSVCPPAAWGQGETWPAPAAPEYGPALYDGASQQLDNRAIYDGASQHLDNRATAGQFGDLSVQADDSPSGVPYSAVPFASRPVPSSDPYQWQLLPDGLLYKSYLAGGREPRFATQWVFMQDHGWVWDVAIGGRVGLLRYGTTDEIYPEGFQIDLEGAVFPRMDLEVNHDRDMMAVDFRVGVPWTVRQGPWEGKLAYYHISSHLGDEFMLAFPLAPRINYVRDCVVLGVALRPHADLRLYTEAGWAFNTDGGAQPWEFQFGIDYSPAGPSGLCGAPFFAINGHLREEVDYGGGVTVQTGWQWSSRTGHLFRTGMQYFNGMSEQRQFFTSHEQLLGMGIWYDY